MKLLPLTMLGVAALLAACSQKATTDMAAANQATAAPANAAAMAGNMSGDMGNMAMREASRTAKGTGVVMAVDKAAGMVTLDHGPAMASDDDGVQSGAGTAWQRASGRQGRL